MMVKAFKPKIIPKSGRQIDFSLRVCDPLDSDDSLADSLDDWFIDSSNSSLGIIEDLADLDDDVIEIINVSDGSKTDEVIEVIDSFADNDTVHLVIGSDLEADDSSDELQDQLCLMANPGDHSSEDESEVPLNPYAGFKSYFKSLNENMANIKKKLKDRILLTDKWEASSKSNETLIVELSDKNAQNEHLVQHPMKENEKFLEQLVIFYNKHKAKLFKISDKFLIQEKEFSDIQTKFSAFSEEKENFSSSSSSENKNTNTSDTPSVRASTTSEDGVKSENALQLSIIVNSICCLSSAKRFVESEAVSKVNSLELRNAKL
ncbi:hypothetical protein OSB04_019608 [Centaurea solstitialis]|uniref:Uncharacterized protein n=1 Tax=Centaurea solstitialis TaxID=347529 RepID=A0AA38SQM6_9ASTR|nr:hypothetical protein OSB04_019608 [Centaurea solstitialis]